MPKFHVTLSHLAFNTYEVETGDAKMAEELVYKYGNLNDYTLVDSWAEPDDTCSVVPELTEEIGGSDE